MMAATANVTINDHAAAAKTFAPALQVSGGYTYSDTASTPSAPRSMTIKHTMLGPSASGNDRHLVSFTKSLANAGGVMKTATVNVTLSFPKDGPTSTDQLDLVAFVKNFLTDANVASLLIGGF